jgi:hypothetical protein
MDTKIIKRFVELSNRHYGSMMLENQYSKELVEMGDKILPLIFEEIKARNIVGWNHILQKITKHSVVSGAKFANNIEINKLWVFWYENRYLKRRVLTEKDFIKHIYKNLF